MRVRQSKLLAALGVAVLLLAGLANSDAANTIERSKQKQLAESERFALRQKLAAIKRNINQTETAQGHAADSLAHSEITIADANRSLRHLAEEQKKTADRLNALSKQQIELAKTIDRQQAQLATQLREQYVTGNEERIKLLLSGDNPNRISRNLHYMGYVSQAQAGLLESLRTNLQTVEKNQADARNAKNELDEIALEARTQKAVLEKEKGRHAALLAQLSTKLVMQRKEAGNVQRDEERLASLVDQLSRLIEEQRKADIAAAHRRRQQQAAREKAQRQKQLASKSKNHVKQPSVAARGNPDAIDTDENPSNLIARNELTPEADVQNGILPNTFPSLRGRLHLPLRGELIAKYGSKRGDGPNWKGLFIRAAEGTQVKAVAAGRVVFADWLRGFGNLIIVDHGSQYLTIYGNNQAILKHAGDAVKTGDVIASAGNSGGNEQSGLYFEMRHQGRAIDPLDWMSGLK